MTPAEILALVNLIRTAADLIGSMNGEPMTPEEIAAAKAKMKADLKTANDLWESTG
ncbi:MAG: hypothetical protein GY906_24100 [bacterium]|nr:hypothetical protein [bacterium]